MKVTNKHSEGSHTINRYGALGMRFLAPLLINWPPFGQFILSHQPRGRSRG